MCHTLAQRSPDRNPLHFGADFSPDGKYRYGFYQIWSVAKPTCLFVGLHPSASILPTQDPQVIQALTVARGLGFGGILLANAFAYKTDDVEELLLIKDPVGPENDAWLQRLSHQASRRLSIWPDSAVFADRFRRVQNLLSGLARAELLPSFQANLQEF